MISEESRDTGAMMLKVQLCITGIYYALKYIKIQKSYFRLIIFHKITVFTIIDQISANFISVSDLF